MTLNDIPPGLILLLGAVLMPLVRGKGRWVVGLGIPLFALADAWSAISQQADSHWQFLGMALNPVHVHGPTPVFATIFCLMIGGGMLFALNQHRRFELPGAFVYAGGALGCAFAGDLLTLFIFWEIMTLGSTTIIFSSRTDEAGKAGVRYFGLHAVGGVLMLIGIVLHIWQQSAAGVVDPLAFRHFGEMVDGWKHFGADNAGLWLILVGMLVNAGAPPFSSWIGDAYPEASESGTVFLSAFTTKTAIFTLMVAFAGVDLLIYLGVYMAIYGIVYAILENDMRRILAYSIVNQVGFMMVGVGVGTEMAIDGACAHAFAHIIYKALLMMSAGAVLYATGRRKCTQLGGLFRTMPVTMWCGVIGALAISSFPLTSGFTTKTMILSAVTEQANVMAEAGQPHTHLIVVWFILEAASAGVFLHAGIKFPWFVFFQKDSGLRPPDAPWNMKAAMILFAGLCVLLGIFPGALYAILPYSAKAAGFASVVYTPDYIIMTLGLLLFSGLAFFVLLPMLKRTETITLDVDWLWRRFAPKLWHEVLRPLLHGLNTAQKAILEKLPQSAVDEGAPGKWKPGSTWAVSVPVLTITLMLFVYLLLYFWAIPAWTA